MTKGGIEARSMIASGVDAYASRQRRGAFQPAATASELDLVNQDGVPVAEQHREQVWTLSAVPRPGSTSMAVTPPRGAQHKRWMFGIESLGR